jgi:hypothetical protein
MKIIRQGVLPKDRVYIGECRNCGTQIKCIGAETIAAALSQTTGAVIERHVLCPLCGARLYVL